MGIFDVKIKFLGNIQRVNSSVVKRKFPRKFLEKISRNFLEIFSRDNFSSKIEKFSFDEPPIEIYDPLIEIYEPLIEIYEPPIIIYELHIDIH